MQDIGCMQRTQKIFLMLLWHLLNNIFCTFKLNKKAYETHFKTFTKRTSRFILAYLLSGVAVDGYIGALIVALVLAILNVLVKPILVIFTLPATILTLGLFLLVINAVIILLADKLVDGFAVANFWWAILFSILLSILQSILHPLLKDDKK